MSTPKTTIDLPFSPEDVKAGPVHDAERDAKFDKAWDIVRGNPDLDFARQRLSLHEFRLIIRAVSVAFS